MIRTIAIHVHGIPQPQGSSRAFLPRGTTKPIITSANPKLKSWRHDIASVAAEQMSNAGCSASQGAVSIHVSFYFQRPKSLRKADLDKITKPDLDKLIRSVLDALTGIVFRDDSQVVSITADKAFADRDFGRDVGTMIEIHANFAADDGGGDDTEDAA